MSTSDNLIISLTVKEGGNLDKLRKQLKSLVGERGEKKFDFSRFELDPLVKRDIKYIKDQIYWLRPTRLPTKEMPKELRRVSSTILKDLEDFDKDIVEKILRTPDISTLFEEFGVETADEVRNKMYNVIKGLKETVGDIFEGTSILPPRKIEETIHTLSNLISESLSKREVGLKFWRAIAKFTPEKLYIKRLLGLSRKTGAKVESERSYYEVKRKALSEAMVLLRVGAETELKKFSKLMSELKTKSQLTQGSPFQTLRELKREDIIKIGEIIGTKTAEPGELGRAIRDILKTDNEELKNKIFNFINNKIKELYAANIPIVNEKIAKEINKYVKEKLGWKETATQGISAKVDIVVEDIEKINKILGTDLKGRYGLEVKRIITKKDLEQLIRYLELPEFKEKQNILLAGEQRAAGVMERAEFLGLDKFIKIIPNIRKTEEEMGLAKDLIETTSGEFTKKVDNLIKEIEKSGKSEEETKKVLKALLDFYGLDKLVPILKDLQKKKEEENPEGTNLGDLF